MKSSDTEGVQLLAGRLHDGVAVGEDADEPIVLDDEDAVDLGLLHLLDRLIDGRRRLHRQRRQRAEVVEVLAEKAAVERERLLRDVATPDVRAAVVAGLGADEVVEPADRAAHPVAAGLLASDDAVVSAVYSTVHVSPPFSAAARSPAPDRPTAVAIWSVMRLSWVGRETARKTPTGTG